VTPAADTVRPGTELPPFERRPGLHHWNRYAAVNDEFVDIHMSDEAGQAAGYPGAIGMGNLQWAYLHNLLEDWLDGAGRIIRLECQFRGPSLRDAVVRARGTVTAVREEDGGRRVDLDVWIEDGEEKKLIPGTATVALPGA
jgi:acyl dehydratase